MTRTITVKLHYATREGRKRFMLRWYTPSGKRKGELLPRSTTKRAAIAAQRAKQCAIDRDDTGLIADPPAPTTLAQFIADMTNGADVARKTRRDIGHARDKLLAVLGPDCKVDSITVAHAERLREYLRGNGTDRDNKTISKPLANATVRKHLSHLSGLWARAQKKKLISTNPFREVEISKHGATRASRKPYTDAEVAALLDACNSLTKKTSTNPRPWSSRFALWMRTLIITAHTTGMRQEELWQLRWDIDIDLDARTWSVSPRPEDTSGRFPTFEWIPKSRAGIRGPYRLSDSTHTILSQLRLTASDGSPYVFLSARDLDRLVAYSTRHGEFPDKLINNFNRHFRHVQGIALGWLDRSTNKPDVGNRNFHTLRKTFGDTMARRVIQRDDGTFERMAAPVLKKIMGHAKIETTMEHYNDDSSDLADTFVTACFDRPSSVTPRLADTG